MNIEELFELRKYDPRWNTSYPLTLEDWVPYRITKPLSFADDKDLSFYIHIPFCNRLCSFCEYTRIVCNDKSIQRQYLAGIANDITRFKSEYKDIILRGFDIGGGTPTALTEENFEYLMSIYADTLSNLRVSKDFEPSIEATFHTLSDWKIKAMVKVGIQRLSLGIQSTDTNVLKLHHRESNDLDTLKHWMNLAWESGIKKINLDMMYGLKGQSQETIARDLSVIKALKPQEVTLYELRTNNIIIKDIPPKDELFRQYEQYYIGLTALGYYTSFGQNTFSLETDDFGVSSYLRSRMLDGVSYKGFGISAQSMSKLGVSYNVGKTARNLLQVINQNHYPEEYVYLLSPKELASKYISIAAYNGSFSIDRVKEFMRNEIPEDFLHTIDFCLGKNLVTISGNNRLRITDKGFRHFGAVFSLFVASLHS